MSRQGDDRRGGCFGRWMHGNLQHGPPDGGQRASIDVHSPTLHLEWCTT